MLDFAELDSLKCPGLPKPGSRPELGEIIYSGAKLEIKSHTSFPSLTLPAWGRDLRDPASAASAVSQRLDQAWTAAFESG